MKIKELLDSLPDLERERLLGRIEGMEMAMRICRNRADDNSSLREESGDADSVNHYVRRAIEAETCATLIRMVQVEIAAGRRPFGDFTPDELDEIWRIY